MDNNNEAIEQSNFCGLWLSAKRKISLMVNKNYDRHPRLVRGSRAQRIDGICSSGYRIKCGMTTSLKSAFTLIELSIVLIIVGLLVGGVLVGRDLIAAAQIRSQISQIEQFKTVAQTFKLKYGYLPGDISEPTASAFGFTARGTTAGTGDGNGKLEGDSSTGNDGDNQEYGENSMFWVDLTYANGMNLSMITGSFKRATATYIYVDPTTVKATDYLPTAKLDGSNIHVFSVSDNTNYIGVSKLVGWIGGLLNSTPSFTALQAYNIDSKIDNGMPMTGSVRAMFVGNSGLGGIYPGPGPYHGVVYTHDKGVAGGFRQYEYPYSGYTATATSCMDSTGSATLEYSTDQADPDDLKCGLSFRLQ